MVIIGATRRIGVELLDQALQNENDVTVLARHPSAIEKDDHRLRTLQSDINDADAVDAAIKGQQAVCVTIGRGPTRKPVSIFSEGIKMLLL